jgi:hypothetical protein
MNESGKQISGIPLNDNEALLERLRGENWKAFLVTTVRHKQKTTLDIEIMVLRLQSMGE